MSINVNVKGIAGVIVVFAGGFIAGAANQKAKDYDTVVELLNESMKTMSKQILDAIFDKI